MVDFDGTILAEGFEGTEVEDVAVEVVVASAFLDLLLFLPGDVVVAGAR